VLYLTDHPENTRALLPEGERWQPCELSALHDDDVRLWRLLGGARQPWCCGQASDTDRAVLIDQATGSQFQTLSEALKAGMPLPTRLICLALAGSDFRGQRDRSWQALRGNVHLTVHYRLDAEAAKLDAGLVMLPAVATARAVEDVSQGRLRPRIKWVNDILIDGCKVAGVLTGTQVQDTRIENVLFGIGLNVQARPNLEPSRFVSRAAALCDFDARLHGQLPRVFHKLIHHLDETLRQLLHQGPAPLYDTYRSLSGFLGQAVRIWPEANASENGWRATPDAWNRTTSPLPVEPIAEGIVQDLLPDLSLRIDSTPQPVRKGRMELLASPARESPL